MNGCILQQVSKRFEVDGRSVQALRDISLSVPRGSFVSIVGYSGCGKSTLLKTIIGLLPADEGSVRFVGLEGRSAIVFQEPRLIASRNVEKNIRLALKHEKNPETREKIIDDVLHMLGLEPFRKAYPWQLSGGMAQRAALGRALCRQPELLLMDEPFGALDALTRARLQDELIQIYLNRDITVLFVTHDVAEAVFLGNRVLVMQEGEIIDDVPVPLPYPRSRISSDLLSVQRKVLASMAQSGHPLRKEIHIHEE
ncbi:ABC transporter ATP-binding protein [Marispirochaeta sp.]|uniref:ABC transporter ATP-binding protein n=1 Tax=Marispirochaeta sp. TaxID=2038653 RepID=UPI0029C67983|nr:ABC transporter ATP-binding protein [Marispirochaeta sp.]